jgi:hypothetical protein
MAKVGGNIGLVWKGSGQRAGSSYRGERCNAERAARRRQRKRLRKERWGGLDLSRDKPRENST